MYLRVKNFKKRKEVEYMTQQELKELLALLEKFAGGVMGNSLPQVKRMIDLVKLNIAE